MLAANRQWKIPLAEGLCADANLPESASEPPASIISHPAVSGGTGSFALCTACYGRVCQDTLP